MIRAALLAAALLAAQGSAMGDELRVLCAGAARGATAALVEPFRARKGHAVRLEFGTAGQILERSKAEPRPDAIVVTTTVIAELERQGVVAAGSMRPLGRTAMGVAVAEGAPAPDIGSVEAFRRALLGARAIAFSDPAAGGTSGRHFMVVLARLGIQDAVLAKSVRVPGGYAAERVASGEADLVVHQISEILPVKGVRLVGPLPAEVQLTTTYAAAAIAGGAHGAAVSAWLDYLAGPEGRRSFLDRGLLAP